MFGYVQDTHSFIALPQVNYSKKHVKIHHTKLGDSNVAKYKLILPGRISIHLFLFVSVGFLFCYQSLL